MHHPMQAAIIIIAAPVMANGEKKESQERT